MNTYTFKTNINCSGCVAKVTPLLNALEGILKWQVDTNQKDKILTVETETDRETIVQVVKNAGFNIEECLA